MSNQAFTEFEHRGWQRVADKYDSTFASSTRQFIAPLYTIEWQVPTADFVFEVERNAGVRTAGLLARQTPELLNAIKHELNMPFGLTRKRMVSPFQTALTSSQLRNLEGAMSNLNRPSAALQLFEIAHVLVRLDHVANLFAEPDFTPKA